MVNSTPNIANKKCFRIDLSMRLHPCCIKTSFIVSCFALLALQRLLFRRNGKSGNDGGSSASSRVVFTIAGCRCDKSVTPINRIVVSSSSLSTILKSAIFGFIPQTSQLASNGMRDAVSAKYAKGIHERTAQENSRCSQAKCFENICPPSDPSI
jgi:hypothetical protein